MNNQLESRVFTSFPASEAKPIVRSWMQEVLVPAGYTVTKTRIYKKFEDMTVTWRINMSSRLNGKGDIGVTINWVLEEWFPDIIEEAKLPYVLGGNYEVGRKQSVGRWDIHHDSARPATYWEVFSRIELEGMRASIEEEAYSLVGFFERRSDPRQYLISVFGLDPINCCGAMENRIECIIALYRVAKSEGPESELFLEAIGAWHKKREKSLQDTERELLLKPIQPPLPKTKHFKNWSEESKRRYMDPLYNHDVLLRDENNLLRTLAVALGRPKESWTISNRLTGKRL